MKMEKNNHANTDIQNALSREYFCTVRERIIHDIIPFSKEEFVSVILKNRPSEIWCAEWSSKMPLFVITEYKEGSMVVYCNAHADKTPTGRRLDYIYYQLRYAGLSESYFINSNH